MAIVYVTRHVHFNASHRLHTDQLSIQQNENLYGRCNNFYGHGHNYELEVTVRGEPDPVTGMVVDLKVLKDIIKQEILDKVDHRHLNHDVEFFQRVVPTSENMVVTFWNLLKDKLPSGELYKIKLAETPRNIAEYYGE